jgi:hypothetical protein
MLRINTRWRARRLLLVHCTVRGSSTLQFGDTQSLLQTTGEHVGITHRKQKALPGERRRGCNQLGLLLNDQNSFMILYESIFEII